MEWTDGAFNGGIAILDYKVQYDQGTSTWVDLNTLVTATDYIALTLTADVVYTFKVAARNVVGYSADSTIV